LWNLQNKEQLTMSYSRISKQLIIRNVRNGFLNFGSVSVLKKPRVRFCFGSVFWWPLIYFTWRAGSVALLILSLTIFILILIFIILVFGFLKKPQKPELWVWHFDHGSVHFRFLKTKTEPTFGLPHIPINYLIQSAITVLTI